MKAFDLVRRVTQGVMVFTTTLTMACAIHAESRAAVRGFFLKDYREVLSTAKAHWSGSSIEYVVAKIKTRESLFLEIYETLPDGGSKLLEKIVLPDSRDGYFSFNGRATNLAIDDINEDGQPEILAPTFDSNLVGHLNVYSFNAERREFEPVIR